MKAAPDTLAFKSWFGDSKVVDDAGKPLVVYHGTDHQFDEFGKSASAHTKALGIDTYFFTPNKPVASTYTTAGRGRLVPAYLSLRNPLVVDARGGDWTEALTEIQDRLTTYVGPKDKEFQERKEQIFSQYDPDDLSARWDDIVKPEEQKELKRLSQEADGERGAIRRSLKLGALDPTPVWRTKEDGLIIKNVLDVTDHGVNDDLSPDGTYNPFATVYVAFKPTQIKSVSNRGTFDPANPKIDMSATFAKESLTAWKALSPFEPLPIVRKVEKEYGVSPEWKVAPGNWASKHARGQSMIAIHAKHKDDAATQLHELGHEVWDQRLPQAGREGCRRLLKWAKTLPVYGVDEVSNPDRRFRVLEGGSVVNVSHGGQFAHGELFAQLFALHHQGKLAGDTAKAMTMLLQSAKGGDKAGDCEPGQTAAETGCTPRSARFHNPHHDQGGRFASAADAVDKSGKPAWSYSTAELQTRPTDELDRLAFGVASGDQIRVKPDEVAVVSQDDMENARYQMETSGKTPEAWARTVKLTEPIDIVIRNGRRELKDGHHRYLAASILGKTLKANVSIDDNAITAIYRQALAAGKPVAEAERKLHGLADFANDQHDAKGRFATKYGSPADDVREEDFKFKVEPKAMEMLQHNLGDRFEKKNLAQLAGAIPGQSVEAEVLDETTYDEPGRCVRVTVRGDEVSAVRVIFPQYRKIYNDLMDIIKPQNRQHGIGAHMLATEVGEATRWKFHEIAAHAAGEHGGVFNGYYTWPRLGFDGPLNKHVKRRLTSTHQQAETLHELFAMPGGREDWKKNGEGVDVKFDLSTGSCSRQVLRQYLKEKGITAEFSAPDTQPSRDGTALSPSDEALLDRIWDRIASEGWAWLEADTDKAMMADHAYHAALKAAAADVEPEPTEAQKESGNYKKGHVTLHGLDITLETAAGMMRRGKSKAGQRWSVKMAHHYGYIKRTESEADGDHVDVFIGPHPESELVYVIDQVKLNGNFDEHKCMLGFVNADEAKKGYLSCYSADWKGFGGMRTLTMEDFKRWLKDGDTGKPIVDAEFHNPNHDAKGRFASLTISDDITGAHHGQVDGTLQAHTPDGQLAAHLDYSVYEGRPLINMVEAHQPGHHAGGHLVEKLGEKYGGYENIDWGVMTPAGSRLRDALDEAHGIERLTLKRDVASLVEAAHGKMLSREPGPDRDIERIYVEFENVAHGREFAKKMRDLGSERVDTQEMDGKAWVEADVLTSKHVVRKKGTGTTEFYNSNHDDKGRFAPAPGGAATGPDHGTRVMEPNEFEGPTEQHTASPPVVGPPTPQELASLSPPPHEPSSRQSMRTAPISGEPTPLHVGANETQVVTLADGTKGIFKPASGEKKRMRAYVPDGYYRREAAASEIADLLGLDDMVPTTVVRVVNNRVGSFQHYVENAPTAAETAASERYDGPDMSRAAAFDYLIGNSDRHFGNWLLKEDGKPALIDHGLSFPNSHDAALSSSNFLAHATNQDMPIPQEVQQWAKHNDEIEAILHRLNFTPEEITLTRFRLDQLASVRTFKELHEAGPGWPLSGWSKRLAKFVPFAATEIALAVRGLKNGRDHLLGTLRWDGDRWAASPNTAALRLVLDTAIGHGNDLIHADDQPELFALAAPLWYKSAYFRVVQAGKADFFRPDQTRDRHGRWVDADAGIMAPIRAVVDGTPDPMIFPRSDAESQAAAAATQKGIAKANEWLADGGADLPDTLREHYRGVLHKVIRNMTPPMIDRVMKNLHHIDFYSDIKGVTADYRVTTGQDLKMVGGFTDFDLDTNEPGRLVVDGGYDTKQRYPDDTIEIYAHELSHIIDGRHEYSNSKEWAEAWKDEIDKRGNPVSAYARKSTVEGWAEFGRMVITMPKIAQSEFPKCWAVWKAKGLF